MKNTPYSFIFIFMNKNIPYIKMSVLLKLTNTFNIRLSNMDSTFFVAVELDKLVLKFMFKDIETRVT